MTFSDRRLLLHVGCGPATKKDLAWVVGPNGSPLFEDWTETRLDIDDKYGADIIGDARDIATWRVPVAGTNTHEHPGEIDFDAVFCSHMLEHVHLFQVPDVLSTFRCALNGEGFVMIMVPNFLAACEEVAKGNGGHFYDSPAGPIFAHEVVFGKDSWTRGNPFQRHQTGFTPDLLRGLLLGSGFAPTHMNVDRLNIFVTAVKL